MEHRLPIYDWIYVKTLAKPHNKMIITGKSIGYFVDVIEQ